MAKLLDPCTVVVVETESVEFQSVTDGIAAYFGNLTCPDGRLYDVHRVAGWFVPDFYDEVFDERYGVWCE